MTRGLDITICLEVLNRRGDAKMIGRGSTRSCERVLRTLLGQSLMHLPVISVPCQ